MTVACVCACLTLASVAKPLDNTPTAAEAQTFMDKAEAELLQLGITAQRAAWIEETYINDDTENLSAKETERVIARVTELVNQSRRFDSLDLSPELRRKFTLLKLSLTLPAPNDPKLRAELTQIASSLEGSYGSGKYCPGGDQAKCMGIDDLEVRMGRGRDPKELQDLWVGWHKVGAPMRDRYARFVELSNQGARELGFADTGAMWRAKYDMTPEEFSADLERLWQQVKPLYLELHAYVRARLIEKYGAAAQRADGMIPADLLGNMWAQEWGNIYDIVAPASAPPTYDLAKTLQARGTDAKQMVLYGEHFFQSMGFQTLPETFWERSMLTKPRDRDVVCHASAWNIDSDQDVRLKLCIHITADDFRTVHHELGHNYYTLAYRNQPVMFRDGANDGFHEAIGDSIALSITPEYLKKIGLVQQIPPPQADIPLLLRTALDKIAFLPFGLLIDKWRWEVFSGQIKPSDYNKAWWKLREEYQGVAPPVDRSEADFDPGAKYHIPDNTPYARYFLAAVYQFQFYRAMCQAAGNTGPLNRCSVYGSKEAGKRFQAMLALGCSKPWPEAMKVMTGEDKADASAIIEYFQPLIEWLKAQNQGKNLGWTVASDPLTAR
ncbi:MAG: M2 family metallopeptidase [Acidobacteriaceae bacterium]|nr:M2 family metallopeptidase [Acidobacteriaceae bacterium]MBV9295987.1 M2 family metallopeptidase [Acidobacteriaceae bacterium]MBV9766650.1 M2 family metallopeptidase [Acidobacteriaceae bacterium]